VQERGHHAAEYRGCKGLAEETADGPHFGDSRYGIQLIADEPVLQGVQRARIVGAINRILVHVPYTGSVGPEDGRYPFGQNSRETSPRYSAESF
jgi:hypothetical protein